MSGGSRSEEEKGSWNQTQEPSPTPCGAKDQNWNRREKLMTLEVEDPLR